MRAIEDISTISTYKRLLPYARPYTARLAIGVVAGLITGGSLYGLLSVSSKLVDPFERRVEFRQGEEHVSAGDRVGMVQSVARKLNVTPTREDGSMTWQFFVLTIIALPVLVAVRAAADYLSRYYLRWVGARVVRDLRDTLFDRLQMQSLRFFGKSDVGQLISNCTNDAAVLEGVISTTISDLATAPVAVLTAVVFVVRFSIETGMAGVVLAMCVVFPTLIIPIVVLGRYVKRYTHRALQRISEIVSRMHENLTGIKIVKAFHMEAKELERFSLVNAGYFRSVVRALRAELLMTPLMEAVGILLVCAFIVVCYARQIALSQIVPVSLAAIVVYPPLKHLARINANLQRGAAALARIYAILDTDTSIKEAVNPVVTNRFADRIVFDHVFFNYDGDAPWVVEDMCMEIPMGSAVALVGETGAGKTTLANLLGRFYDPVKGRILLDGIDLRDVQIASLRRLIGVVTQDTVLFNDTIASNISYGSEGASMEQIVNAAKQANAHEFIMAGPGGYDRVAGEKGFMLSGGEKQRIAIARAVLRNPPILILDEATSALDTVTERLVQEAIARLMEHRTVFAIAHRLSTVRHADQIVLLDRGKAVERGTHQELYSAGGRYRTLCDMQLLD